MDHPTHKLNAYQDTAFKWVTYCVKCGLEENNLDMQCLGYLDRKKMKENKITVDTHNHSA